RSPVRIERGFVHIGLALPRDLEGGRAVVPVVELPPTGREDADLHGVGAGASVRWHAPREGDGAVRVRTEGAVVEELLVNLAARRVVHLDVEQRPRGDVSARRDGDAFGAAEANRARRDGGRGGPVRGHWRG